MAETLTAFQNTKQAFIEETTFGVAATETAAGAFPLSVDGNEFNLERELLEDPTISGSFSKPPSLPGMYSEDIGPTVSTPLRGIGTLSEPAWAVLMKSIMGAQVEGSDGICGLGCTTSVIQVKSGAGDLVAGQLIYFTTQDEIRAIVSEAAGVITLDIPLISTPAEDDTFLAGINFMLASSGHPSFTSYTHFEGDKRIVYAGCLATQMTLEMAVGQIVPLTFVNKGTVEPVTDYTAQVVTPIIDTITKPIRCQGTTVFSRFSGVASGTPTTTETIITTPSYEIAIGDKIQIDVGAGVFETVLITSVSGDALTNTTLGHDAVSVAASGGDTVFVLRIGCSNNLGDTIELTIEMEDETEKCISATSGFSGRKPLNRTVTFTPTPYFKSWQDLLLRDGSIGSALQIILADLDGNYICVYIRNKINTEFSLETDALMRTGVTSQAAKDNVMVNDHEIVLAVFQTS